MLLSPTCILTETKSQWTNLNPLETPSARCGHSTTKAGSKLYLFAGSFIYLFLKSIIFKVGTVQKCLMIFTS